MPPPPPFSIDLAIACWCAECKRPREFPTGEPIVWGDQTLVVDAEPCPQCGCARVVVRPRVKQQK